MCILSSCPSSPVHTIFRHAYVDYSSLSVLITRHVQYFHVTIGIQQQENLSQTLMTVVGQFAQVTGKLTISIILLKFFLLLFFFVTKNNPTSLVRKGIRRCTDLLSLVRHSKTQ